jgi:serine/threonine protein kinase
MKCPKCQFENPSGSGFCNKCGTPLIPPSSAPFSKTETVQTPREELAIGSIFAERYQIIEEVGRGGMGNVYKALDKELGEKVALKLLKPEIAADDRLIERFRNELRFARKITHKNVCRMYDLSKFERTPYITMEYVSGEDLKTTLRRVGPLSTGKAVYISKQVCEGLSEAHKLGVVHRDLKPQNIMIDKKGHAHIMDFGIARSMKAKGVTTSGMMIGTPDYMSPEQVEGKPVDVRADIYAMGVILYEMSTGTTPFHGDTALSVAIKHTREKPRNPRELNDQIPIQLSNIILKCMEKNREKRYQNIPELLIELDKIEKGFPTTDRVLPDKPSTSKELRSAFNLKKLLIPAFAVFSLTIIVLALWKHLPDVFKKSPASTPVRSIDNTMNSANQFWKEKKYSKAYAEFKKVLEVEPSHFEAQFGLANSLKAQDKLDEAIPEYEKAITLNMKDPGAYGQLGLIYEQKKELAKAVNYYKKYLEHAPPGQEFEIVSDKVKNLEARIRAAAPRESKITAPVVAKKRESKEPKPEPEKKAPSKPEKVKAEPSKPEKKTVDVSSKLDQGIQAFNQGNFDECIKQMEEVLKLDPRNASAQYFLSEAKKKKNEKPQEQEISDKLKASQDAFRTGNYQECIKQAEGVLKLAPDNISALNLLNEAKKKAEAERKEQQISDGLKAAQDAFQKGNYQECIDQAKKILGLDPQSDPARRLLNQARLRMAPQQAKTLVAEYVQSINTKNLVNFYEKTCVQPLYQKLWKRTEMSMKMFESLQSTASGINIQFKGINQAEITFSQTITGINKDSVKQEIFDGQVKWDLRRLGENWKIANIVVTPKEKK